ncbi:hypothetical protein BCR33DRAFT_722550 [Rhizoclosmatium globosum]|uniref:G-protein coupled receptors family 1 profile domain-containing protein n=1 Tax=Rhizoclosmatium globosum TaxID=329046 RepID=A0A1Y2BK96_9FUNG|nr:hypothetical protein BCR33DRAFT_722550 [Rhizoclosmatium globosum]|eukprot:ORY35206.1 hypothetical protein BCR33DRAFT_722550 [Rhizoclosmatium globosum]
MLLFACLCWSIISCLRYFSWLGPAGDVSHSIALLTMEALIGTICLVAILGFNLMLAMERYFVMRQRSDNDTKVYFPVVGGLLGVYACIIVWVFSTASSTDSVLPDQELQARVWLWATAFYYITTILAIISLYTTTFLHTRKVLRMYLEMHPSSAQQLIQNQALFRIERKVLLYSVCFGLVVIVCYLPEILLNAVIIVGLLDPNKQLDDIEVWKCVANVFVACDMVITPLLVMYVGPKNEPEAKVEMEKA